MNTKRGALLILLPCLATLAMNCVKDSEHPSSPGPRGIEAGNAQVVIRTGRIGALAKQADIQLTSLAIVLSADGEEPVTDTFALTGNGASLVSHTFTGLTSMKEWTLRATTSDGIGRVIHEGATAFTVRPRQTASVSLTLDALYSMLKADFFPLRDSTTRVELWVDDVKQDDSAFASQSNPGGTVRLAYDYLATDTTHAIRMDVYGSMWGIDTLLYTRDTVLAVPAGTDASYRLTLGWVGPNTPPAGQATMTVALGSIGTHTVEGRLQAFRWQELHPSGSPPDPLYTGKSVHFDSMHNRLIACFPGNPPFHPAGTGYEVWVLTGANGLVENPAWIRLNPTGTPPISNGGEAVGYDEAANRLIVYGGCYANCSPALSEVKVLTHANGLGGQPEWITLGVANPQATAELWGMPFDPSSGRLMVFGGNSAFPNTYRNDIRYLDNANGLAAPSAWSTAVIEGPRPPPRSAPARFDLANNRLMIFGGLDFVSSSTYLHYNDYWVLRNANGLSGSPSWVQLSPGGNLPPARASHSLVYNTRNNTAIVFGGSYNLPGPAIKLNDLWILSDANGMAGTPEWTEIHATGEIPGPRSFHTAAFDERNQRMIVLGGRDGNEHPSNRVWVLVL